jgi:anti-sigma-K factor RskA
MTHCEHQIDAGAYALSALDDAEAATFREHLHTCAVCRDEVEQLQMAVDTLPIVAEQIAPPPALRDRIMRDVRSEAELLRAAGPEADRVPAPRPRSRWRRLIAARSLAGAGLAGGLAAVAIAVAVTAGGDGTSTRTVSANVAATGASAAVHVTGDHAALALEHMPSPRAGAVYQVWFVKGDGKPQPTHTLFDVRSDGRANVQIDEPVDGVRQILVSSEPSGGSTAPTTKPVITARLT